MTDWEEAYLNYCSLDSQQEARRFIRSINLSESQPYENVYEAALAFKIAWGDSEDYYYRGQRKAEWDITPSLLRNPSDIDTSFEIRRLSSAVNFVQSELQIPENIARAIVQHYSDVPDFGDEDEKLRTWLIDITYSPEVAFFFASLGGETGDEGCVYCFNSQEMEELGSSTPKQLGEVEIISADQVPRIKKQRAAFIDHSHPRFLQGYSPYEWRFKQHDDVLFKHDESGITKDNLLAQDDEYVDLLNTWEEEIWPEDPPLEKMVTPDHNPFDEPTQEDYFAIVKDWLEELETAYEDLAESEKDSINSLCEVHARVRTDEEVSGSINNEHALKQAIELGMSDSKLNGGSISFDLLIKYYRQNIIYDREKFEEIVKSVRETHKFR